MDITRKKKFKHNQNKLKKMKDMFEISDFLLKELNNNGNLFKDKFGVFYYINQNNELEELVNLQKIFINMDCYLPSKTSKECSEFLITLIKNDNSVPVIEFKDLSYYDKDNNIFYIYKGNPSNQVYKLKSDKSYELIDNDGSIGIYFKNKNLPDFEYTNLNREQYHDSLLEFFKYLNCGPVEKHCLLLALGTVLLKDVLNPLPILIFKGNSKSGKTTAAKLLGRTLYGKSFNTYRLPDNQSDFNIQCASTSFYAIDNVESIPKWFNDTAAICSTGGTSSKKKLYTDTEVITFELLNMLCLTSMSVPFSRNDILNRSIIVDFPNQEGDIHNDMKIFNHMDYNRDSYLSTIITLVVLNFMKNPTVVYEGSTKSRLNSLIGLSSCLSNDLAYDIKIFLNHAETKQARDNNPLVDMIDGLLEYGPIRGNTHSIFRDHIGFKDLFGTPQKFASEFTKQFATLSYYFNITEVSKSNRGRVYLIEAKNE
jgi:hypothetical protein